MSAEYHKIQSIFKRDDRGRFLVGDWSTSELAALRHMAWRWTEKVDGTNIRLSANEDGSVRVQGRTDRAQIPATLLDAIASLGLDGKLDPGVTLYGEGYGAKIQKGGGNYGPTQRFVLFDVAVDREGGGRWWLRRDDVSAVAQELGLREVPEVGEGTLDEAIDFVASEFSCSTWGPFSPEGIVCRPAVQLFDRAGRRIICKIKGHDLHRCGLM